MAPDTAPPDGAASRFTADTPLPARDEILRLWDEHGMLSNIREHSEIVCAVALLLTDWLAEAGVALQREAVIAGALLHDLAKTACLGTRRPHDREGQEALEALGYPELGRLVGAHVVLPEGEPLGETMIVNYADKRVTHTEIVDLEARFAYIERRYARGNPKLIELVALGKQRMYEVQGTIFAAIGPAHAPGDIERRWAARLAETREE